MCLGVPGKVVEVYREHDLLMGKVDFGGVLKRVCLEYVPEIAVGEYALVHVGFALTRLDEDEAARVFALLKEAGEVATELEAGGGREVS
jgi:hydrogenase expression/formation protein HypC